MHRLLPMGCLPLSFLLTRSGEKYFVRSDRLQLPFRQERFSQSGRYGTAIMMSLPYSSSSTSIHSSSRMGLHDGTLIMSTTLVEISRRFNPTRCQPPLTSLILNLRSSVIRFCQIFRALIPGRGAIKVARTEAEKSKCARLKKDKAGLSVVWRWSFLTKVREEKAGAAGRRHMTWKVKVVHETLACLFSLSKRFSGRASAPTTVRVAAAVTAVRAVGVE